MLLRLLDQIDTIRSLSYRDMPFVLAPNLWKFLTQFSSKHAISIERAHLDGIFVNYDSPEAFEEVFWLTFCTRPSNQIGYHTSIPTKDVLEAFEDYRNLVANPKHSRRGANKPLRRYLSKNNNNLIRLDSLSADPSATILLVYRDPIETALSLYRLHQQFCSVYKEDRFSLAYMSWLGHHEFGPTHRPFSFAIPEMNPTLSPDDPNYWLDYWNSVYQHILKRDELRCHFIEHEAMRARPEQMIKAIFETLGVVADYAELAELIKPIQSTNENSYEFDERTLQKAKQTHLALQASSKNLRYE